MAGDSSAVEAIKVLARGHQNLIWARTRHTNALRSALREYYPGALEAFDDLHDRDALAVSGRAPTPAEAAHLSLQRSGQRSNTLGDNATSMPAPRRSRAVLRTEQLAAPFRGHRRVRRDQPCRGGHHHRAETARSPSSKPAWPSILTHTRTPTSTAPCQDLVSCSAPAGAR